MVKRLAVYAHYDAQDEVKRYVAYHLDHLREICQQVVFVSTSKLDEAQLAIARSHCDRVVSKENVGYDFGMWQSALVPDRGAEPLTQWDEIVLTNSSVFGPVVPLGPLFEKMAATDCDLWALTDNLEFEWHLQSYFLVFKQPVLRSSAFTQFWSSVLPYRNKRQVIRCYEVGLTIFFTEAGFKAQAVAPTRSLFPRGPLAKLYKHRDKNPTCCHPVRLLKRGVPFVKVELLRDNPVEIELAPVYRELQRLGYDRQLIEFDRPATA